MAFDAALGGDIGTMTRLSTFTPRMWLILAHDLDYVSRGERDDFQASVSEVRRMLTSLESVASLAADRRRRR